MPSYKYGIFLQIITNGIVEPELILQKPHKVNTIVNHTTAVDESNIFWN